MKKEIEHNGPTNINWYIGDDGIYQNVSGDISKLIEDNRAARNRWSDYRPFANQDYVMAADIDNVTAFDMLQRFGIDIYGPNFDWKECYKILKEHYPYTLTTRQHMA